MFVCKMNLTVSHTCVCDTSILHHDFILIFIALWAIITHYGTILMPFLSYFIRFTWRGRMPAAGILDWKRSKYERPILHNSKSPENLRRIVLEYIKNIGQRIYQRGPTRQSQARGRALPPWARPCGLWPTWQASGAHLLLYGGFWLGKNQRGVFGMKRRRLEAEPGQKQSRAPAELFCRGNFPPGGGNRSHRHHQLSSHREGVNLHQHLHQNHLLSKP